MSKARKSTIEVLGIWRRVQCPRVNYGEYAAIRNFNPIEFEGFRKA